MKQIKAPIEKGVTCAVMFLTPSKTVLLVHPNNAPWNCWSFPKGLCEANETAAVAASRELTEETALWADPNDLIDLGRFPYLPHKDYHLFLYRSPVEPLMTELICESTFIGRDGSAITEVDNFQFVTIENAFKFLNKKQAEILTMVLKSDPSLV